MSTDWGYNETNGPETWVKKFPAAGGSRQSPVDIATALVSSDASLSQKPLEWEYAPDRCIKIANPGYGWRVDVNGEGTLLQGGPLSGRYKLEQFHCHWGKTSTEGSEHTVNGKSYAGELHLVHWNVDKYKSFSEAAGYPDGLAVLGVFLEVGQENEEISNLNLLIPEIIHKGQETPVKQQINFSRFLPKSKQYWTYLGSLTTPPCSESVIWIVFKEAMSISEEQLAVFRTIKNVGENERVSDACEVVKNYRPPMPLGNRVLRECGSA